MEQDLFDGDFFKRLANLKLNINVVMNKGMVGSRKSSAKGNSLEFSDFRDYILGDDIRHIDWNAYGRTGRLLVKLFTEELEGRFHIFVDGSRSMDFGLERKSVSACRIAGALCSIILNNLDRVWLTTGQKGGIATSPGYTGRQALPALLRQLTDASFASDTQMDQMVRAKHFNGKGVAILISDFYMEKDIEEMIRYLNYNRQQIVLIHTLAREELEPDIDGTFDLIDSESADKLKVTATESVLASYDRTLRGFLGHMREACKRYRAGYLLAPSHTAVDRLLFEAFSTSVL